MGKQSPGQRILHFDAFSGAAGNMILGAMLDLGLSRKELLDGLAPLNLDFKLVVKKVQRSAFAAPRLLQTGESRQGWQTTVPPTQGPVPQPSPSSSSWPLWSR